MVNNRLSEVLKTKKITKKRFAEMVGSTPQYITGICTGKLTVSVKQLARFAELLDVPIGDLFLSQHDTGVFYCPHCGMPIRVIKEGEDKD